MKIALTGSSGLIGSRFFDLLKTKYEIVPIASSFGIDITDKKKLISFLKQKAPSLIVHFAAKANVDACEEDKESDLKKLHNKKIYENGELDIEKLDVEEWKNGKSAFAVNVIGTKNLADYAKAHEIKIIYISTDFVFDGEKGEYFEEDNVAPANWYGESKLLGEKVIGSDSLIGRISFPYGYKNNIKKDLVWTLVDVISKNDTVKLISDQIIVPTFIDDLVNALDFLIQKNVNGLFNITGNNALSPYEIGIAIAREFNLQERKIETITRDELYKNRAPRPFKVILKNDKLRNLGFEMTDFYEALKKIKTNL